MSRHVDRSSYCFTINIHQALGDLVFNNFRVARRMPLSERVELPNGTRRNL